MAKKKTKKTPKKKKSKTTKLKKKKIMCPHCKKIVRIEDLELIEDTASVAGGGIKNINYALVRA